MTTDEIRAAAVSLFNSALAWLDVADPEEQASEILHWKDQAAVARAYLVEHPADDEELVSEDWLKSLDLDEGVFADTPNDEQLGFHVSGVMPGPYVNIMDATESQDQVYLSVPTRGHVRRLLRALGIEVKS